MSLGTEKIVDLIERGALFVINHSAGKDSQAMTIKLKKMIPAKQLLVIHAELPESDWDGLREHIESTLGDLPVIYCRNNNKTFLEMVERRGMFPSKQQRQCTSDLKRDPIDREIRRYLKSHPEFNGLVVSCMGLRAQESSDRAKAPVLSLNKRNSVAGREWYVWNPIHEMKIEAVLATIAAEGQTLHPAYAAGMTRLSCCFCILASQGDLRTAARLKPDLYKRYVNLEKKIGHTMAMDGRGLEEVTGIAA
jgi:3'-phosphoadenosine 5'-phosphosulfate sulfotransferase (PAPS reductase)/FAD synthetase